MKKFINILKAHKVLSSVIILVCVFGIVGGGFALFIHQANIDNTKKALNFAKDGYVDEAELNQLGEDIVLGEEIVLDDGTVAVVTKDENGNYITHTTGGADIPAPTPGHTHTWVAHYTSIHHVDSHKESHTYCTKCHNLYEYRGPCSTCGIATPTTQKVIVVTDREWDEPVIDYYYCSECGARQ